MDINYGELFMVDSMQQDLMDEKLFIRLVKLFPYPIQVYGPDGTLLIINQAFIETFNITEPEYVIGHYNVFKDPTISESLMQTINKAFSGQTTFTADVRVPVHIIKKVHHLPVHRFETLYQDISSIPILDDEGNIRYMVNILITKRIYFEREEISKALEYIDINWKEEFRVAKAAKVINLSPAYFSRLFKKLVGVTPHDYYMNIKIEKLKEKLLDVNITIEEVFADCGVNYHSHYANIFRKKTGFSPSEYRLQVK